MSVHWPNHKWRHCTGSPFSLALAHHFHCTGQITRHAFTVSYVNELGRIYPMITASNGPTKLFKLITLWYWFNINSELCNLHFEWLYHHGWSDARSVGSRVNMSSHGWSQLDLSMRSYLSNSCHMLCLHNASSHLESTRTCAGDASKSPELGSWEAK